MRLMSHIVRRRKKTQSLHRVESVVLQNATQLRFVEHDHVIEAFAPNRPDEALGMSVPPRRARCGWMSGYPSSEYDDCMPDRRLQKLRERLINY
jgi:hypothetical protein